VPFPYGKLVEAYRQESGIVLWPAGRERTVDYSGPDVLRLRSSNVGYTTYTNHEKRFNVWRQLILDDGWKWRSPLALHQSITTTRALILSFVDVGGSFAFVLTVCSGLVLDCVGRQVLVDIAAEELGARQSIG